MAFGILAAGLAMLGWPVVSQVAASAVGEQLVTTDTTKGGVGIDAMAGSSPAQGTACGPSGVGRILKFTGFGNNPQKSSSTFAPNLYGWLTSNTVTFGSGQNAQRVVRIDGLRLGDNGSANGDTLAFTSIAVLRGSGTGRTFAFDRPVLDTTTSLGAAALGASYYLDADIAATGQNSGINQIIACAMRASDLAPNLTVTKTQTNNGPFALGNTIQYSITVTNSGTLAFDPFTLTDVGGNLTACSFTNNNPAHTGSADNNLANGYTRPLDPAVTVFVQQDDDGAGLVSRTADVLSCTASHVVVQADLDAAASYTNTATGTGTYTKPDATTASYDESASVQSPLARSKGISMTKTAKADGPFAIGDTIDYTLVAKNTGTVTIKDVVISDPGASVTNCVTGGGAGATSGTFTMPPNSTVTCDASKQVTAEALADGDLITNVATAAGNAPADLGTATSSDDDTRSVLVKRLLTIEKSVTGVNELGETNTYANVGDVIHYDIVVTNAGDVPLADVDVSDAGASLECTPTVPVASLAVGGTITCTASHSVTQADLDAGEYVNTASAAYGEATPVTDTATAVAEQAPDVTIEKSVVDVEGGLVEPFRYDSAGDVIHYEIAVTNTGNVTLHGVAVADSLVTDLDCDTETSGLQATIGSLAPDVTVTCTASYTVTQGDVDEGTVTNTASVTTRETPEVPDDVQVPADRNPALGITKEQVGGPNPYDAPGAVLQYEIVVTNIGNVTAHDVEVIDDGAVGLDCSPAPNLQTTVATLAPGASVTCSASHTTTQADVDDDGYFNDATAGADNVPQVSATAFTPSSQTPALTLQKSVVADNEVAYDAVGDAIDFEIVATNTGNVTLTNLNISDPNAGDLACGEGTSLAPGESVTCTATHVVTQGDLDAGKVVNVATATATPLEGPVSDEVTVPLTVTPFATIDKVVTDGSPMTAVGEVVTFTVTVRNAGNVTLGAVNIVDPTADLECSPGTTLAPGAEITCSATHVVTQADLDNGSYTNTATVDTDRTDPLSDSVEVPATQVRSLSVLKTVASGAPYDELSAPVAFTITVTNTGNVTLTGVQVTDANATGLDCDADAEGAQTTLTLAPDESVDCAATHVVTQDDMDKGSFTNVAVAAVPRGPSGQGSVKVDGIQDPAMTIDKVVATGDQYDAVGDVVTFTITVKNTGDVTLTGVVVTDLTADGLTCGPSKGPATNLTLAVGATLECTAMHTVTQDDIDLGTLTDTASAASNRTEPVSDDAVATAAGDASLVLDKRIATTPAPPTGGYTLGSVITWTIEVTNDGNVSIHDIHVTDEAGELGDCAASAETVLKATASVSLDAVLVAGELAPGASFTCTATHTVTQADLDAGRYTNLATVAGERPGGDVENPEDDVVAADDDTVFLPADPNIDVVKTVTSSGPYVAGSTVAYRIVVTNNGTVALDDVTVEEQAGVTLVGCTPTIPVDSLAVGATVTCTATHTVTNADLAAGTYRNVVTARGFVNRLESEVVATDTVDQAMALADLAITNTMTTTNPAAGGNVTYSLVVTNNGPSAATDIVVLDPLPTGYTLVSAGGSGWTCTGTTTVRCTVPSAAGTAAVSTNAVGLAPLASGATLPAITVVAFADAGLQGATVTNTATVSGSLFDPVAANNTAPASVTFPTVLGEQVEQTTTTVGVLDTNLPRTGASGTGLFLQSGIVLTGAGAVLLLVSRRRRPLPGRPV